MWKWNYLHEFAAHIPVHPSPNQLYNKCQNATKLVFYISLSATNFLEDLLFFGGITSPDVQLFV